MRYIGVAWDIEDSSASDAATLVKARALAMEPTWSIVFNQAGLLVLSTDTGTPAPHVRRFSCGVVLGTLFRTCESQHDVLVAPVFDFQPIEAARIAATSGRSLIDSYWGSYVLFLQQPLGRGTSVFRGPMSALPCFWTVYNNVTVVFSSIDDCLKLNLRSYPINWDVIRAQAVGGDYLSRETAIVGISAVVSGECLSVIHGRITHSMYWNPSALRPGDVVAGIDKAAQLLRERTQLCVNAWMSGHKTVILLLSGGLDSSVLLTCMSRPPRKTEIISFNIWSRGPGDERRFARSMTEKIGTELIEFERTPQIDLSRFTDCAHTATPVVNFAAWDAGCSLMNLAHKRKATTIFTGVTGDDIFGHAPSTEVLAGCLDSFGALRQFLPAATDYAELKRISLWRAIGQTVQYKMWLRRVPHWSLYLYKRLLGFDNANSLASDEATQVYEQTLARFIHPWLLDIGGMPVGRGMLVSELVNVTSSWPNSPFSSEANAMFTNPLASQPLVEAFFRIPAPFHFTGAKSGAAIRKAFGTEFSELVLKRGTGKGTPNLLLREVVAGNRDFLRELFLDGLLVRRRILDKIKLEAALSGAVSRSQIGVGEIISQLYIECWLRSWAKTQSSAVA
jgi:asparagine synthase (glutamine-hydrolysing)